MLRRSNRFRRLVFPSKSFSKIGFQWFFSNGAGQVRPVCVRFRARRRFNASWETLPFRTHLFRLLTQAAARPGGARALHHSRTVHVHEIL
jgi:hypothetical protein